MNIVNKLTTRHIQQNKGRTVVTTLGICVSVAMITAVFVAMASFLNLFGEIGLISSGKWDAEFDCLNQTQINQIKNDDRISNVGLGYSDDYMSFKLKSASDYEKSTGEILVGNKKYFEMMATGDFDGKLPENENEVAVEENLLAANGMKNAKVGDKITFAQGMRQLADGGIATDGYRDENEKFVTSKDYKEYTITAILHNNPATRYKKIWRGMSEAESKSDKNIFALFTLAKQDSNAHKTIEKIQRDYKIDGYRANEDALRHIFQADRAAFFQRCFKLFWLF